MGKGQDAKKAVKKAPAKTAKEKKAEKREPALHLIKGKTKNTTIGI